MAQQISSKPIRKVAAGALAGATITVIVFVIKSLLKTDVPADVASALTVLLTFGIWYMTPAAGDDLLPAEQPQQRARRVSASPARAVGRADPVNRPIGPVHRVCQAPQRSAERPPPRIIHESLDACRRRSARSLRDPLGPRRGRYGRGVSRPRHQARTRRRHQGAAVFDRRATGSRRAVRARGTVAGLPEPSAHRRDLRRRGSAPVSSRWSSNWSTVRRWRGLPGRHRP